MSLTCGNFAGKSRSYALFTLATVQRAETVALVSYTEEIRSKTSLWVLKVVKSRASDQ